MTNMFPTIIAAQAARAQQRMIWAEEEKMTTYTREDLDHDWEFKIVRASTAAFRKPEILQKLLAEEAQAGWVLVEKFDDSRVRFKRPIEARRSDEQLISSGVDPYRTQYGISGGVYGAVIMLGGMLLALGLVLMILMLMR